MTAAFVPVQPGLALLASLLDLAPPSLQAAVAVAISCLFAVVDPLWQTSLNAT